MGYGQGRWAIELTLNHVFINSNTDSLLHCRYPGTTFMDHVIRYHDDPNVKMMVVLVEVQISPEIRI